MLVTSRGCAGIARNGCPNVDLYQLLAYCTILGLGVGHLVYAASNEQPARHVIREAGTEIVCHALNLDRPSEELLTEIRDLAGSIANEVRVRTRQSAVAAHTPPVMLLGIVSPALL